MVAATGMRLVTVLAGIIPNTVPVCIGPGIGATTIPVGRRVFVHTLIPAGLCMAAYAQTTTQVGFDQKFSLIILMWIMTAGTLQLAGGIKFHCTGEGAGMDKLTATGERG